MLKNILLAVVALIAILIVVIATRPAKFHLERSLAMPVPAAKVFPLVNDFHQWRAWSPWENVDPNMTRTYGGAPAGEGSTYAWVGNKDAGEGRMTIVESRPAEAVDIKVDFTKPFENTSSSKFEFKPEANQTVVTWSMGGRQNFIEKAMCIVFNGKKMIGDEMEKGLSNLKTVAEKSGPAP